MVRRGHPASRNEGGGGGGGRGKAVPGKLRFRSMPKVPIASLHLAARCNALLLPQEPETCPLKQLDHETWDSGGTVPEGTREEEQPPPD